VQPQSSVSLASDSSEREKRLQESAGNMNQASNFPFERARRVTPAENQKFRDAIARQFGLNLRERSRTLGSHMFLSKWNIPI